MFSVGLPFTPELAEAQEAHLDVVAEAMAPWKAEQTYFNFAERAVDSETFYAGTTHDRLREIRERFDPYRAVPRQPAHPARRRGLVGPQATRRRCASRTGGVTCFSCGQMTLAASAIWPFPPTVAR